MGNSIKKDKWVWVVVQNPGGEEQLLGQHDEEKDIFFIPFFLEKEEALMSLNLLSREGGQKYEVQAIIYEDLADRASEKGFMLFLLNGSGEVVEKTVP